MHKIHRSIEFVKKNRLLGCQNAKEPEINNHGKRDFQKYNQKVLMININKKYYVIDKT
jgi:hypothetical protein